MPENSNAPEPKAAPDSKAAPPVVTRSAATIKAEYDQLVKTIQKTAKEANALESELLLEVRAKVRAKAGDVESLMAQKRDKYAELLAAQDREARTAHVAAAAKSAAAAKKK